MSIIKFNKNVFYSCIYVNKPIKNIYLKKDMKSILDSKYKFSSLEEAISYMETCDFYKILGEPHIIEWNCSKNNFIVRKLLSFKYLSEYYGLIHAGRYLDK